MRVAHPIPVLMMPAWVIIAWAILAVPAPARAEPPNTDPSAAEANAAGWAELDAQARITDGDYEGAVQAEQTANEARRHAEELADHAPAGPPRNGTKPAVESPR